MAVHLPLGNLTESKTSGPNGIMEGPLRGKSLFLYLRKRIGEMLYTTKVVYLFFVFFSLFLLIGNAIIPLGTLFLLSVEYLKGRWYSIRIPLFQ